MRDLEKRRRIMRRSMQLGHCICNAKKACPCDLFREKDICLCAGERADDPVGPVRLMSLVESAGCASKIDQATLRRALRDLRFLEDPRVLIGAPAGDDAGVYQLDDRTALVQTVDVFSPAVDDPYTFGQIAAANSLSDVYAMGGRPLTALSIVGFPSHTVPEKVLHDILRGGIDKMNEAGVPVVGGHSINDNEIKAGFAVTGLIDPAAIMTNAGAQPGDCLVLTKPLGTGVLSFAAQIDRAPDGSTQAAAAAMAALNLPASHAMLECRAHACTDVTGFGLAGHLGAMATASQVDVEVVWDDLPLFPGVVECLAAGIASGALERNRESSSHYLDIDDNVQQPMIDLCFDPQTSGGLLIALAPGDAAILLAKLRAHGNHEAAIIGKVLAAGTGRVHLRTVGRRVLPATADQRQPAPALQKDEETSAEESPMSCCEGGPELEPSSSGGASDVPGVQRKFLEFLQAAGAPGALDAKAKQAIAIALSVYARCEPCVKSHVKKARDMGFSQEEIDEAAWIAISFGGSPVLVFYNGLRKDL